MTRKSGDLPKPLVDAGVDLRDFKYLPLDVVRLRDSDLAGSPDAEVFRAAVLSWCVAWHQSPAASLPDDDLILARLLGYGRDINGWRAVREAGGLRGWILCSDGRLYHPVVAEKANEAWSAKQRQRDRTEAARVERELQRQKRMAALQDELKTTKTDTVADQAKGLQQTSAGSVTDGSDGSVTGAADGLQQTGASSVTASKGRDREGIGKGEGEGSSSTTTVGGGAGGGAVAAGAAPRTKGARLSPDFVLPKAWGEWTLGKYPHWTREIVLDIATQFRNHWVSVTGAKGTKLDWYATWQNWCMSDKTQRQYPPPKTVRQNGSSTTHWADERRGRAAKFAGPAADPGLFQAIPINPTPEAPNAIPTLLG